MLRDGMGQATGIPQRDALDLLITNALIIDYTGVYKADIAIKNGRIAGIGKAGNPAVMRGVSPGMIMGVTTEVLAGEGMIVTAGGIDTHVHFICPQQIEVGIASDRRPGRKLRLHRQTQQRAARRVDRAD